MVPEDSNTPLTPTPASQWQTTVKVDGTDLALPSGNIVRIRRMSPQTFLTAGVIPNPLLEIITASIRSKRGMPPEKVEEMSKDAEKIQASLEMFDRVMAYVALSPVVKMPPTCNHCNQYYNVDERHKDEVREDYHRYDEGPRDPNVLYSDIVDIADKMFVFQFCLGGTRDLESFRSQLPTGLGGLSDLQDLLTAPK